MTDLAGQTALVTGGARGIGRAVGRALRDSGSVVYLADRDGDALEATARELGVRSFVLDVTDRAAFLRVVAAIERERGALDLLVNNAGVMALGGFLDQDAQRDDLQLAVNVGGVLNGMRAALPGMLARRRGRVINVASVAGKVGTPLAAVYSASKHAVIGLSESVRRELDGTGVTLGWVLPGVVATELTSGVRPLRWPRVVTADEVAAAVVSSARTGAVETWVPRVGRLAVLLPALLPRRAVEAVGKALGVDRIFQEVDRAARAAYEGRLRQP